MPLDAKVDELIMVAGTTGRLGLRKRLFNRIIPLDVFRVSSITDANLSHNDISEIPPQIATWEELKTLDLRHNNISQLPEEIGELQSLTSLNISDNPLKVVPWSLGRCTALTELSADFSVLECLPPEISCRPAIESIPYFTMIHSVKRGAVVCKLAAWQLSSLPSVLLAFDHIQELSLDSNNLKQLPSELVLLTSLSKIQLSKNSFEEMPAPIYNLSNLASLDIADNTLPSMPPLPPNLATLQELHMQGNRLGTVPRSIGQLLYLKVLDLSFNQIAVLPDEIGSCASLLELRLHSNNMRALPSTLSCLRNLSELRVESNPLRMLHFRIGLLPLQKLTFDFATFESPPPEVMKKGVEWALNYFRRLCGSELRRVLVLDECGLFSYPSEIMYIPTLTRLSLMQNKLAVVPPEISLLTSLTDVNFSLNVIHEFSDCCAGLTRLQSVNLADNQLVALPFSLGSISNLQKLTVLPNPCLLCPPLHVLEGGMQPTMRFLFNVFLHKTNQILDIGDFGLHFMPAVLAAETSITTLRLHHSQFDDAGSLYFSCTPHLKVLKLSNCALEFIPPIISQCTALEDLDVSWNRLVRIGNEIRFCKALVTLEISHNPVVSLPDGLYLLSNFTNLVIEGVLTLARPPLQVARAGAAAVRQFQRTLERGVVTGRIDLTGVGLSDFSCISSSWSSMKEFLIDGNNIVTLPSELALSSCLQLLSCASCGLASFPHLSSLQNSLTSLDIRANKFLELPAEISVLHSLKKFRAANVGLVSTPPWFSSLSRLQELDLSSNKLNSPSALATVISLVNLTKLCLENNGEIHIPPHFERLRLLKSLSIRGNGIQKLPMCLIHLSHLKDVDTALMKELVMPPQEILSKEWTYLAKFMAQFQQSFESLELDLASLQLRSFPVFACDNTALRSLNLCGNEISVIPEAISRLTHLTELNLRSCPIKSLPIELGSLSELSLFHIDSQYLRESASEWGVSDESMLLSVLRSLHIGRSQNQLSYDFSYCRLNHIPGHENCAYGFYHGWTQALSLVFVGNSLSDLDQLGIMQSLLSLNLAANKVSRLPASFQKLSGLTSLNLSANLFSEMPLLLSSFHSLRFLDFSSNKLVGIPQYFKGFTSLSSLRLSFNPISSLPFYFWTAPALNRVDTEGCCILSPPVPVIQFGMRSVVKYLEKVEDAKVSLVLSLCDYNLVDMPSEPLKVHGLTSLDLSRNKLSAIPDCISILSELSMLAATYNCIASVSEKISTLARLKHLQLSHNAQLLSLPESMVLCTSLTELWIDACGFRSAPVEICNSGNLKSINLMNCPLLWPNANVLKDPKKTAECLAQFARTVASKMISFEGQKDLLELPVQLSCNASLTDINVSNCSIKRIDGSMLVGMTSLTRLRLDRNFLSSLPDEMCELLSLKDLRASSNVLTDIPFSMTALNRLTIFEAASNSLEEIPLTVRYWLNIRALNLAGNSISAIPQWIGELVTLRKLNLSENSLQFVPTCVVLLTNLISFVVSGNKLRSPPSCLVDAGDTGAILRYLAIFRLADTSICLDKMNLTDVGDMEALPCLSKLHSLSCSMNPLAHLHDSVFHLPALTHLNTSHCCLSEIPPAMTLLTQLLVLDVSHNILVSASNLGQCLHLVHLNLSDNPALKMLDHSLGKVSLLTTLNVIGCRIEFPPPEIMKRGVRFILRFLEALRLASDGSSLHLRGFFLDTLHERLHFPKCSTVSIANNQLRSLPELMSSYTACTHLDLSGNMLQALPGSISCIKFLKILLLDDNMLSTLPPSMGMLEHLRVLSLGYNALKACALPDQPTMFSSLSRLILDSNPLQRLPAFVTSAPLKFLSFDSCEVNSLPPDISCKLSSLTQLSLSNNQISVLPDLSGWIDMQKLKICNNCLSSIPNSIQFLTSLTELSLVGNIITDAPVELGLLSNITYLHLGDSFAGEIPQEILRSGGVASVLAYLNKLKAARTSREFDLRHFGLKNVPYIVKSVQGLRKLSLDGNSISILPLWLCDILSLTEISLLLCPLSSLPVALARLTNLTNLRLPPGGILFPPPDIVAQGTASILSYLSSILQHRDSGICSLDGMGLLEFPVELCRCDFITHLDLRNNKIEQIPPDIALLTRLKELRLEGCPIDAAWSAVLDRGLAFLLEFCSRALVVAGQPGFIDLSDTRIASVPLSILEQHPVAAFVANNNPISKLPSSFQCCSSLTQISLVRCSLVEISQAFADLKNLIYLDLSHNRLQQLPDYMKNMVCLQNLNLCSNPVASIDVIKHLTSLVMLNVEGTCLADVPLAVAKLPQIESVLADWSSFPSLPTHQTENFSSILAFIKLLSRSHGSNTVTLERQSLVQLPPCVLSWISVVKVDISYNKLVFIDEAIFDMPSLESLNISNNCISILPHALHRATRLMQLDIRHNPIFVLPVALGACVKPNFEFWVDTAQLSSPSQEFISRGMKELLRLFWHMWCGYMSRQLEINQLKLCTVPENIFDICNLVYLSLCHNELQVLPPGFRSLTLLKRLDVSFNHLNALCPELCCCSALSEIIIDGNPMLAHCPPKPLLTAGISFVQQYLRVLMLASSSGHINLLATPTPGLYLKDLELPPCHTLNLSYRTPSLMSTFVVSATNSQLQALTSLSMLNCGISEVPSFVSTLNGLKTLNLGFNKHDIHCNFQLHLCAPLIEKLMLHSCGLSSVPDFLMSMSTLRELCLSDNIFHRLPDGFFMSFPQLTAFTACCCGFEDIEPSLFSLHATLTKLDFSFNPLPSHALAQLASLSCLKSISVYGCSLKVVPPRWGFLKSIEFIGVEDIGLENVPSQVVRGGGQLVARYLRLIDAGPATVELDVSGMHLEVLPGIVRTMHNLQSINISDNPIIRLPSWLGELKHLESFHCKNMPLVRLPATLGALPQLSVLDCTGCPHLRSPPANIVSSGYLACTNYLRRCYKAIESNQLDVAALGLSEFPYEAASSPSNLVAADAKCNAIQMITLEIKNFYNLQLLDLSDNNLRMLPWEIGFLSSLQSLMLQKNPLQWLPFTVGSSPKLHTLIYDSDQIIFPSRSVSMLGCQASIAFLRGFYGGWSSGCFDVSSSVVKLQCVPPELLLLMASIDVRRFDYIMGSVLKERSVLIETQKQLTVTMAHQDYLMQTNVLRTPATPHSIGIHNFSPQSPVSSPVRYALELYQACHMDYNFKHADAARCISRVYLGHLGRRYFTFCAQLMIGLQITQDIKPVPAFDRFMHKVVRPVTAEFKQRHSYEVFIDRASKHFSFDADTQQLRVRPQSSPEKSTSSFQRMMQEFDNQVAEDFELQQSFGLKTAGIRSSTRANKLDHTPSEILAEHTRMQQGSQRNRINSYNAGAQSHLRPLSSSSAASAAHRVGSSIQSNINFALSIEVSGSLDSPRVSSFSPLASAESVATAAAATPLSSSNNTACLSCASASKFAVPAPLNITIGGEEYNESSPVHRALLMSASRVNCASEFDALWMTQDGMVVSACDDDHFISNMALPSSDSVQESQFNMPLMDEDLAREAEVPHVDEASHWHEMLQCSKLWVETAAPNDWIRLNPSSLAANPFPTPALTCDEYLGSPVDGTSAVPLSAAVASRMLGVKLASMNIAGSGLNRLPQWVVSLSALTSLNISNNHLGHFPAPIVFLVHLVALRADSCAIKELPAAETWPASSLALLSINNNSIQSVSTLQSKPSLVSLSVSKNSMRKLIISPGAFRRLRTFVLADNPLIVLVFGSGSCSVLEYLNLQNCRISVLSPSISRCVRLQVLLLSYSRVASLPPTVGMLSYLHTLHLRQTRIHLLPPEIACCVALRDMDTVENDMIEPPQCVIDAGVAVVMSYMSRIIEGRRRGSARLDSFNLGAVTSAILGSVSLRSLELRRNSIAVIPHAISLLTCLCELMLSYNSIKIVPDELLYVTTLNVLTLDNNQISVLPIAFGNLRRLQVLDLSQNHIQQLPISLGDVRGMVSLTIANNPLAYTLKLLAQQSSSAVLEFLRTLHDGEACGTLFLSGRGLFDVPRECGLLKNLRRIVMKDNQLKCLPVEVFRELNTVVSLDLSYNNFEDFPEGILPLTQLQQLDMSHNPIKRVGAGICNLSRLNTLLFDECPIESFPWSRLKDLQFLETLSIQTVDPSLAPEITVPGELCASSSGMYLSSINQCRSNGVLDLAELGLAVLPPVVNSYIFLVTLNLNGNSLLCLPDSISKLTQLVELSCMDNRMRTLPGSIGACGALVRLNVACNRLVSLPAQLAMLRKLKVIYINDNPELMCPPPKVYLEGPAAILQFCERLLYAQLAGSRLDLSQMQLTQIHIPVERCVVSASIILLNLDSNCFTEVPSCMAQFTSLQELSLKKNRLTHLPTFLNVMKSLQVLHASDNNIEQVPVPVCLLPRLRTLDVSHNKIRFLPPQVAESSTLTSLSLHANDLRQLPSSLASMASLRLLTVYGNQVAALPEALLLHASRAADTEFRPRHSIDCAQLAHAAKNCLSVLK